MLRVRLLVLSPVSFQEVPSNAEEPFSEFRCHNRRRSFRNLDEQEELGVIQSAPRVDEHHPNVGVELLSR